MHPHYFFMYNYRVLATAQKLVEQVIFFNTLLNYRKVHHTLFNVTYGEITTQYFLNCLKLSRKMSRICLSYSAILIEELLFLRKKNPPLALFMRYLRK